MKKILITRILIKDSEDKASKTFEGKFNSINWEFCKLFKLKISVKNQYFVSNRRQLS